jgi:hypothetical protein
MKFKAGDLEFNASVVESSQSTSPQTGNPLQQMTISFRAQKAGMHEAAVTEALQRQSGGLFSLDDSNQPDLEWRVRESNWNYMGQEPWGVNHHQWRIEQVERLLCTRLIVGGVDLEPFDYAENLADGRLRLAARALISDEALQTIAHTFGVVDVTRVGISEAPRQMRLSGYVWGERPEGLVVVLACEDIAEPRVTVEGFLKGSSEELDDLIAQSEELIQRRHARRRVQDVDGWHLMQ